MTTRYPGGLVRKTPPTITPPVGGEGGSAPGVWTLEQASYYIKQGTWPQPISQKTLYSWGTNQDGPLGQNDRTNRSSPTQVGSGAGWQQITNSGLSVLAIKTDGTLWAWGENATYGQLGLGDKISRSSPVQVGALTNWKQVNTTTGSFTIAIKTDGTMWGWGFNQYRYFQTVTNTNYSSPIQIGSDNSWDQIGTRAQAVMAIKQNKTLWAWGYNVSGTLGTNNTTTYSSPIQIGAGDTWLNVSSGYGATGAITTTNKLYTWGANVEGQLGLNGSDSYSSKSSPTQVGALTNWKTISMAKCVAAIKTDGTLWTWGSGTGALMQNDQEKRSSPTQVGSLTNWFLASAAYDNIGAIKTDGTLWMAGVNATGSIGDNTTANKSSPVQVGSSTKWASVEIGNFANRYPVLATLKP